MELNGNDQPTVSTGVCNHPNNLIVSVWKGPDGKRRRRRKCRDCGHKWTDGLRGAGNKLSEADVIEILGSPRSMSNTVLAERFGVSRETVRQVRCGMSYKHVKSDMPRPDGSRYCTTCIHFKKDVGCRMQFPDYEELGAIFASECEAYKAL